jgi:hypothetical protein
MKNLSTTLAVALLSLGAMAAQADRPQDCIVEGTVDKQKAEQAGTDVYVAFHSARETRPSANCDLGRRHKVEFKAARDSGIENAPNGAKVKYRYTKEEDQQGQWKLLEVGKF